MIASLSDLFRFSFMILSVFLEAIYRHGSPLSNSLPSIDWEVLYPAEIDNTDTAFPLFVCLLVSLPISDTMVGLELIVNRGSHFLFPKFVISHFLASVV